MDGALANPEPRLPSPSGRWPLLAALAAGTAIGAAALIPARAPEPLPTPLRSAPAALAGLPSAFEPNRGQSQQAVRFLARGPGYGLFLTRRGATLAFESGRGSPGATGASSALSMELVGAAAHPGIRGIGRLPGEANYLSPGSSKQAVGIPTFSGVRYTRVWPGIGMRFHGDQRRLEYDFDLAPGAKANRIDLRFTGQRRLALEPDGTLVLHLGSRSVREPPPRAYQMIDASRRPVASHFTLRGEGRVGVAVGPYDHERPLTIDPRIVYSTYLGNGIEDPARAVAVDPSGSAYVTGETASPHFPVTHGALRTKKPWEAELAYVAKLAPGGRHLVYSTYFGREGPTGNAIAVDRKGAAFVAGSTGPYGIPTTGNAFQRQADGMSGFVAKLAPSGRRLVYSTYLGGAGGMGDEVGGIALDRAGNAYVTGDTESQSFPVTPGAAQSDGEIPDKPSLLPTAFVAKLNRTGSRLLYSTYLGGNRWDAGSAIAVDRAGAAYVTGFTESRDFPVTRGSFQRTNHAGAEFWTGFVTKVNPTGTAFPYSTYLGGGGLDQGTSIAVDRAGRAHVAGMATSGNFPTTPGAFQRRLRGFASAFVSTLSRNGSRLSRSTLVGTNTNGRDIALDRAGNAYLVGFREAKERHDVSQGYRGFLAVLDASERNLLSWAKLGGNRARAASVALGPSGDVYAVGGSGPGLKTRSGLPHQGRPPRKADYPTAFVARLRVKRAARRHK